uniref:Uncharacterized protein n=1 Tax=Oryza glumipatula TaxID=40148 RepID=A0A0E0BHG4_9ORYZ
MCGWRPGIGRPSAAASRGRPDGVGRSRGGADGRRLMEGGGLATTPDLPRGRARRARGRRPGGGGLVAGVARFPGARVGGGWDGRRRAGARMSTSTRGEAYKVSFILSLALPFGVDLLLAFGVNPSHCRRFSWGRAPVDWEHGAGGRRPSCGACDSMAGTNPWPGWCGWRTGGTRRSAVRLGAGARRCTARLERRGVLEEERRGARLGASRCGPVLGGLPHCPCPARHCAEQVACMHSQPLEERREGKKT